MLRILGVILFAAGISSCGSNVEKTENKSFILAMAQGSESYKPMIKRMIIDYNQNMGFEALEFSDSIDSANSPVIITKGLEKRDGKVGWGQWFSQTERRGHVVPLPGTKTSETVSYRLQVEFDEDFLNSNTKNETDGSLNLEVRKLFAHEIGHGFQLSHVEQEKDVMYYDISGDKDFSQYWPRVRSFFGR